MHVSLDEARSSFAALLASRLAAHELAPLAACYGRILAQDLSALVSHPSATDSALDGVACREADTLQASPDTPARLRLIGESRAGAAFPGAVSTGEAVRIYTGAPLPDGADAICPVEQLRDAGEGHTELLRPASPRDVRHAGSDFRAGEVVLRAGQLLTPQRVALAAALGHARLPVRPRLRVGLLSTGDEVVEPGERLQEGQVYNSNLYGLLGLVQQSGHETLMLGSAPDSPRALSQALERAGGADLLLTSGGVSMGRYDLVRDLLIEDGEVAFWKVRMRPGGPALCGSWRGTPLFGLPGNPVSALVVFEVLVRPALTGLPTRTVRLRAGENFRALPDKTAFWRGVLREGAVVEYPKQASSVLRSLSESDVLVIVPEGQPVRAGEEVEVMLS
ncbi:molybdenum cofactor synthesis domain protein [Deinococcus peraridilitoris DSM 19664]|uniref:Molybdopterin molybdenumtransferase n=2 Tax=Deinococcus TaxID=1298 RepID=L0A3Q1_DEIPD|nr:molybdenum cofactor synthesis domain protein [Deinococcus peraridilitoris DSM 19664]